MSELFLPGLGPHGPPAARLPGLSRRPPLVLQPDTSTSRRRSHAASPRQLPTQPLRADRPRASFGDKTNLILGTLAAGGEEPHVRSGGCAGTRCGCMCLGEGAEGLWAHLRPWVGPGAGLPALETCLWVSDRPVCLGHPQC